VSETAPPSDLFASTAHYYARFRPGYPDAFFRHVVARFGLDGTGTLLDLGCGTGHLALPLAAHVAGVIGLDPEPEMLAEAAAAADRAGVRNARWLRGGDRDLDRLGDDLGAVRLVTIGRAFHWMDQDATLRSLARIVVPTGGLVVVSDTERIWNRAGAWQEAVQAVIRRWLGPAQRAGSGTRATPHDPFDEILARSPFARVETYELTYRREATVEEIVGYLYSTSYCSPAVLGENREPFEAELRRTLRELDPAGVFAEEVELGAWLAWRP
jgi:SAM-dependent methyltransferase